MMGASTEDEVQVLETIQIEEHVIPIQSTVLTRLISYNDSKLCDKLTNFIFLLLTILLLACLGYVIAFCIYPRIFFFGFGIDEQLTKMIQKALKNQWKCKSMNDDENAWFTYHKLTKCNLTSKDNFANLEATKIRISRRALNCILRKIVRFQSSSSRRGRWFCLFLSRCFLRLKWGLFLILVTTVAHWMQIPHSQWSLRWLP